MSVRRRGRRPSLPAALCSAAVALALTLAGCSNDTLAQQWNEGSNKGYIGNDGTFTEYPVSDRGAAARFSGPLDTGGTFDSSSLLGKVSVINFWYAGCAPCRAEAPILAQLDADYGDRVEFLGINVRDQAPSALAFSGSFGIQYPSILDQDNGSAVVQAYAGIVPLNAVPTTLVLDREGRVAKRILGQIQDASVLRTLVDDVLAEGS